MHRVERETDYKIIVFRSDNAKEYISNIFTELLEDEGISRQLTAEYTPQQNGVAERANRTLVEMARCMLVESGLPRTLWAKAISMVAFIRNRCPTSALQGKAPFEMWTGKKPDVTCLRVFGCKAFALQISSPEDDEIGSARRGTHDGRLRLRIKSVPPMETRHEEGNQKS